MSQTIQPAKITAPGLTAGFSLEPHTVHSTMKATGGFNNEYSVLGQYMHHIKYGSYNKEGVRVPATELEKNELVYEHIAPLMADFADNAGWLDNNVIVMPVPSYLPRGNRDEFRKPQYRMADAVSHEINQKRAVRGLQKNVNVTAKRSAYGDWQKGAFTLTVKLGRPADVLLIDDIYGKGMTVRACVAALREDPNVRNIYFLSATYTRADGLRARKSA